jgi:membrane-associated protein
MHTITNTLLGYGYIGIAITLFFESGVFLFFLPGDTLLLAAGIYASAEKISFPLLILWGALASTLGAMLGFYIGKRFAQKKLHTTFFTDTQIQKTEHFFGRFGTYAVLLNRFIPIVRTIAPVVAGASGMRSKDFHRSNIFGACLWVTSITGFGYVAGTVFPGLETLVPKILFSVIVLSFILLAFEYYRNRKNKNTV